MPRPKAFDPDVALESAMQVFWRKGYHAASIQDLVEAMNINRFSLYNTFGDKAQLFDQALQRYVDQHMRNKLAILHAEEAGLDAIHNFFRMQVAALSTEQGQRLGCMLFTCASELSGDGDNIARQRTMECIASAAAHFTRILAQEQRHGHLHSHLNIQDCVAFLLSMLYGMGLTARIAHSVEQLNGTLLTLEQTLASWRVTQSAILEQAANL